MRPRPDLPGPREGYDLRPSPSVSQGEREPRLPARESLLLRLSNGSGVSRFLRPVVRPAEKGQGGKDCDSPPPRRDGEGSRPPAAQVLPRHAAAGPAGPGADQRPGAALPPRAPGRRGAPG